jgi:hypothetical protein
MSEWYWDPGHQDYIKREEIDFSKCWVHRCPVSDDNIVTYIGLECPHCRTSYNELTSPLI